MPNFLLHRCACTFLEEWIEQVLPLRLAFGALSVAHLDAPDLRAPGSQLPRPTSGGAGRTDRDQQSAGRGKRIVARIAPRKWDSPSTLIADVCTWAASLSAAARPAACRHQGNHFAASFHHRARARIDRERRASILCLVLRWLCGVRHVGATHPASARSWRPPSSSTGQHKKPENLRTQKLRLSHGLAGANRSDSTPLPPLYWPGQLRGRKAEEEGRSLLSLPVPAVPALSPPCPRLSTLHRSGLQAAPALVFFIFVAPCPRCPRSKVRSGWTLCQRIRAHCVHWCKPH